MIDEICVIGFPSRLGGADTELDHQIRVWQHLGVKVHLIHTFPLDHNCHLMQMEKRGCVVHRPRDWAACEGKHVIAYCNSGFLENIEAIRALARTTTFVNCMTWLFEKEKEAHKRGLIDFFVYQTNHVIDKVGAELRAINACYRPIKIDPYFHLSDFPFTEERSDETFRFARISRSDPAKFHPSQLWIYETMVAPVLKSGIMLGVDNKIREKIGTEPDWIRAFPAGEVSVKSVYECSHCLILASETYENLPRIAFEAMASGCLLIVDDRGGWQELVKHRETGYLCKDPRDFVYYASRAAYEIQERNQMVKNAREWLNERYSLELAGEQWLGFFETLSKTEMNRSPA
ncbi:Glycosyl transferases group 1 [Roseimaritima multifibrata]|uniref:Glycosyl transferases group 1 n=1 Tax=Roseimaritima multifibrata TaxID=1930274 RepID=A0A517M981_9BACT|nr:Glycosyl transferases group 1 [Roseimaritima multifibrata]